MLRGTHYIGPLSNAVSTLCIIDRMAHGNSLIFFWTVMLPHAITNVGVNHCKLNLQFENFYHGNSYNDTSISAELNITTPRH